jgi:hypothetical protein
VLAKARRADILLAQGVGLFQAEALGTHAPHAPRAVSLTPAHVQRMVHLNRRFTNGALRTNAIIEEPKQHQQNPFCGRRQCHAIDKNLE